jgi:hypothetical protein
MDTILGGVELKSDHRILFPRIEGTEKSQTGSIPPY